MALEKGMILVIHRNQDDTEHKLIVVEQVIGPIKGEGWLIVTREGNMALVANYESKYTADCSFIVDGETQRFYIRRAKRGG